MQIEDILELKKELDLQKKANEKLQHINEKLQLELEQLKRMIFGSKSEKHIVNNNATQATLFELPEIENIVQTIEKPATISTKTIARVEKGKPVRSPIPENIERREIVLNPENLPVDAKLIGQEITEILELDKLKFFVKKIIRNKYKLPTEDSIVIPSLPERIVNKSILGNSVVVDMIIKKYVDHIPVHRQQRAYKRHGIELAYNTLIETINNFGNAILPIAELIAEKIVESNYIMMDETTFKVIDDNKKGQTHLGYMWVTHSPPNNLVAFNYRQSRSGNTAKSILENFTGYLQTDAYAGYNQFNELQNITHLYCMAHVRRKFTEAKINNIKLADEALDIIQNLYYIEQQIREENYSHEQILQIRQGQSKPILQTFFVWLSETKLKTNPSSTIGKAINYALNCYEGLLIYTQDAMLQIDNNWVENKIRPVALGRNNYLFAGSHNAAKNAATFYTIIGSCIMNNICPQKYFEKVFEIIPTEKVNNLAYLLPNSDFWKSPETA